MQGTYVISAAVVLGAVAATGRGGEDVPPDFILLPGADAPTAAASSHLASLRIVDRHQAEIDLRIVEGSVLTIDALLEVVNVRDAPLLFSIHAPGDADAQLLVDRVAMAPGSRTLLVLEAASSLEIGIRVASPGSVEIGFEAAA